MHPCEHGDAETNSVVMALERVTRILSGVLDIVDHRVDRPSSPAWCERRRWSEFLLGLSDSELSRCEHGGLGAFLKTCADAPSELRELAQAVGGAVQLPSLAVTPRTPSLASLRSVSERKQGQLGMLLAAIEPMALYANRIVDVGAGSGHLTRLAASLFQRSALGLDISPQRVEVARARSEVDLASPSRLGHAEFLVVDACQESLGLAEDDLAVGLHACGELGDRLVTAAAEAECQVALVSCCLQKLRARVRAPLSRHEGAISLRKETLGLANLSVQARGVEATLDENLRARETRFALGRLLRSRDAAVAPGAEMRGINRRRAQGGLFEVSSAALKLRGLAPPSAAEVREHELTARRDFSAIRRLSLPRNLLGRLIEVAVVLDRANALAEAGLCVRVALLVDGAITPRNVAIFASRFPEQLPAITTSGTEGGLAR